VSNASRPPDRRLAEKGILLGAAIATAFSVIAAIIGYIEVGSPFKLAGGILAVGIGYWIYRSWNSPSGFWLPDPWRASLVLALAALAGFALAWNEERPAGQTQFDFIVNPHTGIVAAESVAPAPRTESRSAPLHGYGDHMTVTCYVQGSDKRIWYRLADQNFISEKDLVLAPLAEGSPPEC